MRTTHRQGDASPPQGICPHPVSSHLGRSAFNLRSVTPLCGAGICKCCPSAEMDGGPGGAPVIKRTYAPLPVQTGVTLFAVPTCPRTSLLANQSVSLDRCSEGTVMSWEASRDQL